MVRFFTFFYIFIEIKSKYSFFFEKKAYFMGAHGVIIVYDVNCEKSFENINFWIKKSGKENREKETFFLLVGNKIDLSLSQVYFYIILFFIFYLYFKLLIY